MAVIDRGMDRQQLDRSNAEFDEEVDQCRGGQPGEGAAVCWIDVGIPYRNTADVKLEDDRLFPRDLRATILTPGEGRLDNPAFGHMTRIVASIERQIRTRVADTIAEQGIAPAQPAGQSPGIGIDQQLAGIEAV